MVKKTQDESEDLRMSLSPLGGFQNNTTSLSPIGVHSGQYNAYKSPFASDAGEYDVVFGDDARQQAQMSIHLTLVRSRMVFAVTLAATFFVGFSVFFFVSGVIVTDEVYETIGDDTESERLVELYNAISGFLIEFVQVFVWIGMDQIIPVVDTYLLNICDPLHEQTQQRPRVSRKARQFAAWLISFCIILLIENSSKAFQASQKTVGYKLVMEQTDLMVDEDTGFSSRSNSKANSIKENKVGSYARKTILHNSVMRRSTPFVAVPSRCALKNILHVERGESWEAISLADWSQTSVSYGFAANEWNEQAFSSPLQPDVELTFNMRKTDNNMYDVLSQEDKEKLETVFDLEEIPQILVQGFAMYDHTMLTTSGGEVVAQDKCEEKNDPDALWYYIQSGKGCRKVESVAKAVKAEWDPQLGVQRFMNDVTMVFKHFYGDNPFVVKLKKISVSDQISLTSIEVERTETSSAERTCGLEQCVIKLSVDTDRLPVRTVKIAPFMTNCEAPSAKYDTKQGAFVMSGCTATQDSVFVYGHGHEVTASQADPRDADVLRHDYLSFAKISWATTSLSDRYQVECNQTERNELENCEGLSYRIKSTGQLLLVGKQALPTEDLQRHSLTRPLTLLQLHQPPVRVLNITSRSEVSRNVLEPIVLRKQEDGPSTESSELPFENCSPYVKSFIQYFEANRFSLKEPLYVAYSSAFFYLFENASLLTVSDDTAEAKEALLRYAQNDDKTVEYLTLQGDVQVRELVLKIPDLNKWVTIGAAILFVLFSLCVSYSSFNPLREWDAHSSSEAYLSMIQDHKYSDRVHHKAVRLEKQDDLTFSLQNCDQVGVLLKKKHQNSNDNLYKVRLAPANPSLHPADSC